MGISICHINITALKSGIHADIERFSWIELEKNKENIIMTIPNEETASWSHDTCSLFQLVHQSDLPKNGTSDCKRSIPCTVQLGSHTNAFKISVWMTPDRIRNIWCQENIVADEILAIVYCQYDLFA